MKSEPAKGGYEPGSSTAPNTSRGYRMDNREKSALRKVVRGFFKTKMCTHFMNGHCRKGPMCQYAHSEAELRRPPDLTKTRLCEHFLRGPCLNKNCRFAHSQTELRASEEFYRSTLYRYSKGCDDSYRKPQRRRNQNQGLNSQAPQDPPRGSVNRIRDIMQKNLETDRLMDVVRRLPEDRALPKANDPNLSSELLQTLCKAMLNSNEPIPIDPTLLARIIMQLEKTENSERLGNLPRESEQGVFHEGFERGQLTPDKVQHTTPPTTSPLSSPGYMPTIEETAVFSPVTSQFSENAQVNPYEMPYTFGSSSMWGPPGLQEYPSSSWDDPWKTV